LEKDREIASTLEFGSFDKAKKAPVSTKPEKGKPNKAQLLHQV
jgi:hypothetical protein